MKRKTMIASVIAEEDPIFELYVQYTCHKFPSLKSFEVLCMLTGGSIITLFWL